MRFGYFLRKCVLDAFERRGIAIPKKLIESMFEVYLKYPATPPRVPQKTQMEKVTLLYPYRRNSYFICSLTIAPKQLVAVTTAATSIELLGNGEASYKWP